MAWTNPRTWITNEFVTSAILNTHVRDNMLFLKSNPLIAVTTATTNQDATGTQATAIALNNIAIPADVGAVYVEAWALSVGYLNPPGGGNFFSWSFEIVMTSTVLHSYSGSVYASSNTDANGAYPYYARSTDQDWAGSTRSVSLRITGTNCTARASASGASPIKLRIVRAY